MNCCYGLVNEEWKFRKKINEREENKERLQKKTPKICNSIYRVVPIHTLQVQSLKYKDCTMLVSPNVNENIEGILMMKVASSIEIEWVE